MQRLVLSFRTSTNFITDHFTCTSVNAIYCITHTDLLHEVKKVGEKGRRLDDRFRENLRDVERNNVDAFKPIASQFNLPNHFKQHMAICGLSPCLGRSESRETIKTISQQCHNDIPQLVDVVSSIFREYLIQEKWAKSK